MALVLPEFPNSAQEPFTAKSPKDTKYNCIGWACGSKTKMWPNAYSYYWPPGISNTEHVNSFIELFQTRGYEICLDGNLEVGYLKIAIYGYPNGRASHAARQLQNGEWTSKLGIIGHDVEHSIAAMANGEYGNVAHYMRKAV